MNLKELATSQAALQCRTFCVEPHWRVYLAATKWQDGSDRNIVIFECLNCEQLRYLDLDAIPEFTKPEA